MQNFLNQYFWGNNVQSYIVAAGIFIIGLIVIKVLQKIILRRLKKWAEQTETSIDDLLIKSIEKSIIPLLFYAVFYSAITSLTLSDRTSNIVGIA